MIELLIKVLKEIGTKEIEGPQNNPTIVNYAKESGFKWVNDDETPWCSILINWAALKTGYERTKQATARSWLLIGKSIQSPEIGDIVVFKRGTSKWQGHVGIYISEDNYYINVLGGNQSNQVKISSYKKTDLLGFRRLNKV